jgi:hypothetical protein
MDVVIQTTKVSRDLCKGRHRVTALNDSAAQSKARIEFARVLFRAIRGLP